MVSHFSSGGWSSWRQTAKENFSFLILCPWFYYLDWDVMDSSYTKPALFIGMVHRPTWQANYFSWDGAQKSLPNQPKVHSRHSVFNWDDANTYMASHFSPGGWSRLQKVLKLKRFFRFKK
jgi:hypothetical protein